MKSNKEFIQGIYIKASLVSEEKDRVKNIHYRKLIPIFMIYMFIMICVPGYVIINNKKADKLSTDQNDTEDIEPANMFGISRRQISFINIISGEVEEIKTVNNISYALVQIESIYEGSMTGKVSVIYDMPEILNEDKITMEVGENVLLFLEENIHDNVFSIKELRYGKTVNGIHGKYMFIKEENNDKIYEASDGSIITESEIGNNELR